MEKAKRRNTATRKWKKIILYITAIVLIFLTGVIVFNKMVQNTVKEKLSQLAPVANIGYSSMKADLFASRLSINDLTIKFRSDTGDHQYMLSLSKCQLTGIDFLKMVFHQKLFINKFHLVKGNIRMDQNIFDKKNLLLTELSARMPLKKISINQFQVSEVNIRLNAKGDNKLLLKADIKLDKIEVNNSKKSYGNSFYLGAIQCTARDISYTLPNSHTFQIKQFLLNSKQQILKIDSLKILNENSKQQPDNIMAFFPSIEVSRMDIMQLFGKRFIAGNITIDESRVTISNKTLKSYKEKFDSLQVKNISVNHFVIKNSKISLNSGNINHIEADKIVIDSLNKAINKDFVYSSVECHLSNIRYSIPYRSIHIKNLTAVNYSEYSCSIERKCLSYKRCY